MKIHIYKYSILILFLSLSGQACLPENQGQEFITGREISNGPPPTAIQIVTSGIQIHENLRITGAVFNAATGDFEAYGANQNAPLNLSIPSLHYAADNYELNVNYTGNLDCPAEEERLHPLESPHNYTNNYSQEWVIEQPGADYISLSFSRIGTEAGYDYLRVYDANRNLIQEYSGEYTDALTPKIPGGTAIIELVTDTSITAYGFSLEKYKFGTGGITYETHTKTINLESPHDYPNNYQNQWTIEEPGAEAISLTFSALHTEKNYDFVKIYDEDNNLILTLDGDQGPYQTPEIPGDKLIIELSTDHSVSAYGFQITGYSYRIPQTSRYEIRTARTPNVTTDSPLLAEVAAQTNMLFESTLPETTGPGYHFFRVYLKQGDTYLHESNVAALAAYPAQTVLRMLPRPELTAEYPDSSSEFYQKPLFFLELDAEVRALKVAANFRLSEFIKESNINYGILDPLMIQHAQNMRTSHGISYTVNSGYRSPAYNSSIGGATYSRHMYGDAVDIDVPAPEDYDTWNEYNTRAKTEGASYIEPCSTMGTCPNYRWLHADWRYEPKGYQNF